MVTASEAAAFASVVETSENPEGDQAIESQAADSYRDRKQIMDEVFSKGFELWQATLALAFAVISLAGNWLPWLMWSGFCYFCIDWPQARRLINGQTAPALLLLFLFASALLATMDTAFSPIANGNPPTGAWRLAPWTAAIVQLTFIVGMAIAMGTLQLLAGHRLPHLESTSETIAQKGR